MTLVLYDLYSNNPDIAWSPSTWKIRYCLNLKGLAHKTEWVEFPDLEPLYQKLGVTPTVKNADGSPRCSVPLLYDPATGRHITDSLAIADYLDATYPEPAIFPPGTRALQALVEGAYFAHVRPLMAIIMPAACEQLNPVSEAYYRPKRVATFGKPAVEGLSREEQWTQYRDGLGKVAEWYEKVDGPFLMGDTVSWGDFVVAGCIIWLRVIWGADSEEWRDVRSWHGGRWGHLIDTLKDYEKIY